MKKVKLQKGLQLNKEVVSQLQEDQLANVKGGMAAESGSCYMFSCNTSSKKEEKEA
ncbi:class I lanthipeptide [Psychroserpens luteolus]|uniref:class I lanthipeptide n=1 Tax=Psychroserpens luteolus TaxID=2855840 RepID=UPI001E468530|nr:class I lanthipeptide [Psychroserpens luteolus]MCD2258065.1 class I lanthipeptide [Psychroserpens luteolus]